MINNDMLSWMVRLLSGVQRMVVSHNGTLQELLTAYFGRQVDVRVCNQVESNGVIIRNSVLYIDSNPYHLHRNVENAPYYLDVCIATSVIPTTSTLLQNVAFVDQIKECKHGIGYILDELGIKTHREILSINANDDTFHRVYRIHNESDEINIIITEVFPTRLYM